MLFLILVGIKKSLLDVAVYWISVTGDYMWLHSGHCCLFHCNVSFLLASCFYIRADGNDHDECQDTYELRITESEGLKITVFHFHAGVFR
jgi:hypothetical protein